MSQSEEAEKNRLKWDPSIKSNLLLKGRIEAQTYRLPLWKHSFLVSGREFFTLMAIFQAGWSKQHDTNRWNVENVYFHSGTLKQNYLWWIVRKTLGLKEGFQSVHIESKIPFRTVSVRIEKQNAFICRFKKLFFFFFAFAREFGPICKTEDKQCAIVRFSLAPDNKFTQENSSKSRLHKHDERKASWFSEFCRHDRRMLKFLEFMRSVYRDNCFWSQRGIKVHANGLPRNNTSVNIEYQIDS